MTEKQEYIIKKIKDISNIAEELMKMAVTGEDGNLYEMSYHIQCYSGKIIKHLEREWKNNIKFNIRKQEKAQIKAEEKKQQYKEMKDLEKQIFEKFLK